LKKSFKKPGSINIDPVRLSTSEFFPEQTSSPALIITPTPIINIWSPLPT
ncbi:11330_t:CDS:1, partial [Entrophospora sp. SA101]